MDLPKRKPTRLKEFDYSTPSWYFLTICTQGNKSILSRIVGEGLAPPESRLTPLGRILEEELLALPERYENLVIDTYVIMPNHIHLLLGLLEPEAGGASPSPTIPDIVRVLKSMTTRRAKLGSGIFQRSYHDHIVRGEKDYKKIQEYIENNPGRWIDDRYFSQ